MSVTPPDVRTMYCGEADRLHAPVPRHVLAVGMDRCTYCSRTKRQILVAGLREQAETYRSVYRDTGATYTSLSEIADAMSAEADRLEQGGEIRDDTVQ